MVEPASIEVSDLRSYDEGWYECSVVSMEDEQSTVNGSWIYLTVNGKSSCIALESSHAGVRRIFIITVALVPPSSTFYLPSGTLLLWGSRGYKSEPFTYLACHCYCYCV